MPIGQPKMESAILANGLLTGFIRLRAAMKLSGMARRVPKVVASKARKTVSMIFSQVSWAVLVKCGVPTLLRRVARIYCTSSLSRSGMVISKMKCPASSVSTLSRPRATTLAGHSRGQTQRTGGVGCKVETLHLHCFTGIGAGRSDHKIRSGLIRLPARTGRHSPGMEHRPER